MQSQISFRKRLLALLVVMLFALGTALAAGTETAAAKSKLKVTPKSKTIYVGKSTSLKANKKVKWSVYKGKKYVKITSKKKTAKKITVKGLKKGTAYLKAKKGKSVKKVKITVKTKPAPKKSKVPTKINLVASQSSIGVGDTCTVYVKSVTPSYASKEVNFSSSDTKIAKVSREGIVTGVSDGDVTIKATSKESGKVSASVKITVVKTITGTMKFTADFSDETKFPKGKVTRLWIPIPESDKNQLIPQGALSYKAEKASKAEYTKDSSGNKALYVMWDENVEPKDRTVELSFEVTRREILRPDNMASLEKGSVDKAEMAQYLKETQRSGSLTSGIVKETADKIVKDAGAKTVYQKAYAIYDWICENLRRDDSTPAIGSGEVQYILNNTDKGIGKCTDVNSVFVALCRAEGIAARSVYGLKLDSIMSNPDTQWRQKCKPQFYLPGYGWAEADASALLKLKKIKGNEDAYRGENASAENKGEWKRLKDEYWGSAGPDSQLWMMLSTGGDIELSPRQSATSAEDVVLADDGSVEHYGILNKDGTLNYFVYPYAEYDGKFLKPIDNNKENIQFNYQYTFQEGSDDCGC